MPRTVDERIVIVDIDEKSLSEEWRWPWRRDHLALMMDKIVLDELKLAQQALKLYRAQNWDMAELQLINLQKMGSNATLYELFVERVKRLRASPPPAWNGVWVFETK